METQSMAIKHMTNQDSIETPAVESKVEKFGRRILTWISANYKILVEALDEGERMHQLVQERKDEEMRKMIRDGLPYRMF